MNPKFKVRHFRQNIFFESHRPFTKLTQTLFCNRYE